jgi:hypothetical protein
MATKSAKNPPPINPSIDDDAGMAKGEIPELTDFFKGTTVIEEELQGYHSHG